MLSYVRFSLFLSFWLLLSRSRMFLYLTRSDVEDIFFSKMGGMIGMERKFDLIDLLHCSGSLNKLAKFECIVIAAWYFPKLIRSKNAFGRTCISKVVFQMQTLETIQR